MIVNTFTRNELSDVLGWMAEAIDYSFADPSLDEETKAAVRKLESQLSRLHSLAAVAPGGHTIVCPDCVEVYPPKLCPTCEGALEIPAPGAPLMEDTDGR